MAIKTTEQEAMQAAIKEMAGQVSLLTKVVAATETKVAAVEAKIQAPQTSKWSIVGTALAIISIMLVLGSHIVDISRYNERLAGDNRTLGVQLEHERELRQKLETLVQEEKVRREQNSKDTQTLREMYFLKFGTKLPKGE